MFSNFPRPISRPTSVSDLIAWIPDKTSRIVGDRDTMITAVASLDDGLPGTIAFCHLRGDKAREAIAASGASVVVCYTAVPDLDGRCFLEVDDPRHWYGSLLNALYPDYVRQHPCPAGACDGHSGRFPSVNFGANCTIHPGVTIGPETIIGNNVTIYGDTQIGSECEIADGCVIGSTGISYTMRPDASWQPFPHLGRVVMGDRVRLGSNSVVNRGQLKNTVIQDDVKTGAQVNIAHNCMIGNRTWISAGVVFCGSVQTGEIVFIGAGAVIANRVKIGAGGRVAAAALVVKDVAAGGNVLGQPARPVPYLSRF